MNDQPTVPATPPESKKKPRKAREARKTRSPRIVDPGIAAIHSEMKQKVADYRKEKSSERIFRVIVEKRLPQMDETHRQALFDVLSKICTPTLIPDKPSEP